MTLAAAATALLLAQAGAHETLTYEDALRSALARNPDLAAARAKLDQARTVAWKTWAAQLPQLTAGASWTRNDARVELFAFPPALPEGVTLQPLVARSAQVQATLPLFAPQLWHAIGAATAAQRQAELGVEAGRRELLFGVAQAYYGAVASRLAVGITERQLAIARDHERDTRVREQAGTAPRAALLRAEIDRARAEQDLESARAAYASARAALATMLDEPGTDFDVEAPGGEPLDGEEGADLEASALRDRPDVAAAEAAVRAAARARGAVWAGYLPSVAAFAREQWQDPVGLAGEHRTWTAGVALTWNVFDGTLREAQLEESGAKVAEAVAVRRGIELRVREEVVRARLDLGAARANLGKAREQARLARENQRLVELGWQAGAGTYLEASDANAQLVAAELALVGEQMKAQLAALRVLKAAGRFAPR